MPLDKVILPSYPDKLLEIAVASAYRYNRTPSVLAPTPACGICELIAVAISEGVVPVIVICVPLIKNVELPTGVPTNPVATGQLVCQQLLVNVSAAIGEPKDVSTEDPTFTHTLLSFLNHRVL